MELTVYGKSLVKYSKTKFKVKWKCISISQSKLTLFFSCNCCKLLFISFILYQNICSKSCVSVHACIYIVMLYLFYRFFLASFYTKYDFTHFILNFSFLVLVLLPKLPQFHMVRLFGINKY